MLSKYILKNSNSSFKKITHYVAGRSLLKAAIFHATSEAEYAECKELIPGWNGFVLPNLIWLPRLDVVKPENTVFTIIFLSRIHPKKGIELLMEAISTMPEKLLLRIEGTGDENYISTLKQKAKALNIDKNIEWGGWKDRVEKFRELMHADLMALTSYNENFANVVIETLHVGTPVLISDKVGLYKFVQNHKLGWICEANSGDIKIKLQAAIADKENRKRINSLAQSVIEYYLSEEKILPRYLLYYGEEVS